MVTAVFFLPVGCSSVSSGSTLHIYGYRYLLLNPRFSPHFLLVQSILPSNSMADLPNHTQTHFANTFSEIADNLDRGPLFSGLRRRSTSGQIQRGDTYMERSRFLLEQYGPIMTNEEERLRIRATYNE